ALTPPAGGMPTHRCPLFPPGGNSFLSLAANHDLIDSPATALHVRSLDGKSDRVVTHTLANVAYVDGRLLMLRESTLIYQAGGSIAGTHLIWFGHDGTSLGALADVARYYDLKLSPDGHRLVT